MTEYQTAWLKNRLHNQINKAFRKRLRVNVNVIINKTIKVVPKGQLFFVVGLLVFVFLNYHGGLLCITRYMIYGFYSVARLLD